ncbi:hypothetical protein [Ensifer canadensis]|uniref:hypothetical protein n=1 Tax=Ensifer canadensis TaxID=555315 RepID=UPI0035E3D95E
MPFKDCCRSLKLLPKKPINMHHQPGIKAPDLLDPTTAAIAIRGKFLADADRTAPVRCPSSSLCQVGSSAARDTVIVTAKNTCSIQKHPFGQADFLNLINLFASKIIWRRSGADHAFVGHRLS